MTHQQAQNRILEILGEWQGREGIWIHLHGEEGAGKRWLIEILRQKHLKNYPLLLRHNFEVFPWLSSLPVQNALRHSFSLYKKEFEQFLEQYPAKLAAFIRQSLRREASKAGIFPADLSWEFNLWQHFATFLSRKYNLLLILENIFATAGDPVKGWMRTLENCQHLPLLIISSGKKEADLNTAYSLHNIHLQKLSVKETEKVILSQLQANIVNARVITNHLYIKSGGNLRNIKFMAEAFYRPLLAADSAKIVDSAALGKTPVSPEPDKISRRLIQQLPEKTLDIFAFLSRLEDPLPESLLLKIFKNFQYEKKELKQWLERGFLERNTWQENTYVRIGWDAWKEFLRKNTSVERINPILKILKNSILRKERRYPLEFSGHFFDAGDIPAALAAARKEAPLFAAFGMYQRAFDRYAFLRRNLPRFPDTPLSLADILKETGELQKKSGLFENAFESFRELRECLGREEREEWIAASLEMADTLLQMDALSETRYLIKELQIKESVSARDRLYANILMGELERNFGHREYAQRHFEAALSLLPQVKNGQLLNRLYGILKEIYLNAEQDNNYVNLLRQIMNALDEDAPHQFYFRLELVKFYSARHNFSEALPLTLAIYRSPLSALPPSAVTQVRLILAEIYGYYGKWYLSRSHLMALLKTGVFLSNINLRLRAMVNLGIVEKELGHYSPALELLQEALDISLSRNLISQAYHIKIHLGHIYLLVNGFMRSREHLMQALEWAEENQDGELLISAALFLSSYELQQNRLNAAGEYLDRAQSAIQSSGHLLDRLNYYYYQAIYQLKAGKPGEAAKTLDLWEKEGRGITKFENLWLWLTGRVFMEKGNYPQAQEKLEAALERGRRYRLGYLELQVLRDLMLLAKRQGDNGGYQNYFSKAQQTFRNFLEGVGDEILQRQVQESREYEELFKLGSF